MEQKFLKCEKCGNIVAVVHESGVPLMCCGQKMNQIIPGSVEASVEKHIPVFEVKENKVYENIEETLKYLNENYSKSICCDFSIKNEKQPPCSCESRNGCFS